MPNPLVFAAVPLVLAGGPASAPSAEGSGALALAALVGAHAPALQTGQKAELALLLDGRIAHHYPAGKIVVRADSVVCRTGDVDIAMHACTLSFGKRTVSLGGRAAHELYATLIENGVQTEGAAGSVYAGVGHLACTVDPHEVGQESGGGASCTFSADPP